MTTPIERAARDLYYEEANDSDGFDAWPEWESHDNPTRDIWRQRVRSALEAATEDVDELAAVIAGALYEWETTDKANGADLPDYVARAVVAHLTKGDENDE